MISFALRHIVILGNDALSDCSKRLFYNASMLTATLAILDMVLPCRKRWRGGARSIPDDGRNRGRMKFLHIFPANIPTGCFWIVQPFPGFCFTLQMVFGMLRN
jgi:hypothetical protein